MRQIPLLKICISFILGILTENFLEIPQFWTLFGLLLSFLATIFSFQRAKQKLVYIPFFTVFSCLFLFSAGISMSRLHTTGFANNHFSKTEITKPVIIGKVVSKKLSSNYHQYIISVDTLQSESSMYANLDGKLLVYSQLDSIEIGDVLQFQAEVSKIQKNANAFVFDYQEFMDNKGIAFQCFPKEIVLLDRRPSLLAQFRQNYIEIINQVPLNHQTNAILKAMIAGEKSDLGEMTEVFRKTGASHVLAISGLHVGIIALLVQFLCSFLPTSSRMTRAAILTGSVWLFCLASGCFPSTIRACTMVTAYSIAMVINRKAYGLNICFFAAFIMLLINPKQLFDIGFQFSFLALMGIMLFFEPLSKVLILRGLSDKIWQLCVMSFSAQIFILPLSLYYFHSFPIYFLPASIIAVPLTFVIVCLGILTLILEITGFQFELALQILEGSVHYFVFFLEKIAQWPGSTIDNLWPHVLEIAAYFGILAWISQEQFLIKRKNIIGMILSVVFLLAVNSWKKIERSAPRIIVYAHSHDILIDYIHDGLITRYHEPKSKLTKRSYETSATESYFQVHLEETISLNNNQNQVLDIAGKRILIVNRVDDSLLDNADFVLLNTDLGDQTIASPACVIDFSYSRNANQNKYFKNYQIIHKI